MLYIFLTVLFLWILQQQWKRRRILSLSRMLRNKYIALPLVGHGLMLVGTGKARMKTVQKIAYEAIKNPFGITSFWLGTQYYAITSDPVVAEIVAKTSLDKTELQYVARHLLGNGSVIAPINIWRPRRKILAPTFCPKNINHFVDIFAELSLVMVDNLKIQAGKGTFSIWKNIVSYTVKSVCKTALGANIEAENKSYHPLLLAFKNYFKFLSVIVTNPWIFYSPLYKLAKIYYDAEKSKTIIHGFVENIIREKKSQRKFADSKDARYNKLVPTFLDLLITSSGGSQGYTDIELREEILVLLIAGTDTSAVGACFTTLMMSRNEEFQEKAYKELRDIFGDSKRPITIKDLPRLTYTEAIIKETLRLYPPVPLIVRKNETDVVLPSGITLPVNTCTGINIWGIHRNPKYWGADAEEFNPDRFLNGRITHRSAFMPFSCGPRNCLGNKYAMTSMKVLIATLLREYRVLPPSNISSRDKKEPIRLTFDIMMKDVDNFKVRLEQR